MGFNRREFIESTAWLFGAGVAGALYWRNARCVQPIHEATISQRSFSVTPVIGDGKWIWTKPPADGQTGYLEPREFEVHVGIGLLGKGLAGNIQASTVAPVSFPEQEVTDLQIDVDGCSATVSTINDSAAQLVLAAPLIERGQRVSAVARYRIKLKKDYRGFSRESFPAEQSFPTKSNHATFAKEFLSSSPGINTHSQPLKALLKQLDTESAHPWDQAQRFYEWVWENIKGIPGKYTSVEEAIRKRRGDCEERATVFIALCRAAGIPARLVWVPSHNWAEIGLYDHDGTPHWIPVHTAGYSWFGWTGVHEVVLQKGDRIQIPARKRTVRLIDDWYRLQGKKPEIYFSSTITPTAPAGQDPGPGARQKMPGGVWKLAGHHPDNSLMRDK